MNCSSRLAFHAEPYMSLLIFFVMTSNARPKGLMLYSPVETQVLAALQFYSSGSFQWMVGRSTGLSQASVSRVITGVTDALCNLAGRTITFPLTRQTITDNKQAFSAIAGFPNVIGAIDCTHIPVKSPANNEEAYVNRKKHPHYQCSGSL